MDRLTRLLHKKVQITFINLCNAGRDVFFGQRPSRPPIIVRVGLTRLDRSSEQHYGDA